MANRHKKSVKISLLLAVLGRSLSLSAGGFSLLFSVAFAGSGGPGVKPTSAVTAPVAKKSQFNSQIYENAPDEVQSFTAVVKIVREIQGDTQVFFEGKQGFYTVSSGSESSGSESLLVTSQKKHIPVAVTVRVKSRQVIKVDLALDNSQPSAGKPN